MIKKYEGEEITVVWEPDKCIHSAKCVEGSPSVFRPQEKPWIVIDGADADTLRATIERCPSGALSYIGQDQENESASPIKVVVVKDGPLLLSCRLEIEDSSGDVTVSNSSTTAFCRCGASSKKPFCDGSHRTSGFEG